MNEYMPMTINYSHVINDSSFCSVAKLTALMLQKTQYMSLGDFFKALSDYDIKTLSSLVEKCNSDDYAMRNLLIISEMLSRAEGTEGGSLETISNNLNYLCIFITCVALARNGKVDVIYENMSFGDDMRDKTVVTLRPAA